MKRLSIGAGENTDSNPQTLLFSATLPHWVHETAKKYLRPDRKHLDLVCDDAIKTSKTVMVCAHLPLCGSYWMWKQVPLVMSPSISTVIFIRKLIIWSSLDFLCVLSCCLNI